MTAPSTTTVAIPATGASPDTAASAARWRTRIVGAYHWQHEPCYYAVRDGATADWRGDRTQTTLWEVPTVHATRGTSDDAITPHGTQKPVEVMARPLRNHRGDVYDPFTGSGTTLIAAEREGRRAFCMELDPGYAQVALERWQAYTGLVAERC